MDNCDLEKLSVSGVKLHPAFKPEVTDYKVTVESSVDKVTLHLSTSDCGASHRILFGEGSSTIKLNVGLNRIEIEVVAEDGTIKKYCVEITRLSAKVAELSNLALAEDIPLYPAFCTKTYEYNGGVPFHCNAVTLLPTVPDKNIKVTVNGESSSQPVPLNFGDTMVEVSVHSADGSNVQVYTVLMTRELIPMAVTFTDKKQQLDYECPISLTALYRPVSINQSDPKHIFSRPYIEMLARRSKVDPLSDSPLGDGWKVVELDLDRKMSTALVKCFFTYQGCDSVMKLSELGSHSLDCAHKPTGELDAKDVTETSWYKKHFASSSCLEIETKHSLEVRNWEKRLQLTVGEEDDVDKLCDLAQDHMKLYRQRLPKPGEMLQTEEGQSPLHNLEQAAIHYASAISLSTRDARLHFMLGVVLHEQHHATEMYGRQKKADKDKDELSDAKSTALQDDILAVCKLHGFPGTPTVQNQLQALDKEYQTLREQGQSGKADYVQTLYIWLSKQSGKDSSAAMRDEESYIHRALMKYLDAWSLSPDSWEFNLHVGRLLLLLQGRSREALQHLQSGLALRPLHPALRFFTGLALLKQEQKASADTEKEAALFLQQGLEHFVSQRCSKSWVEQDPSDPLSSLSTQFLRGLLTLGELQQRNILSGKAMDTEQVYHTVAVLTAQSVSQCVCRGELSARLEWVLLDAQFALLQRLIQQGACQAKAGIESPVAKRCQALTALIRLTSIAPCQELLDMQERACQLAVLTTPRDSHSLCLLGLAQLAQYDNNPNSDRSKEAMTEACLSFQASIELENKSQSGEPPEQLSKQKWWQKWHEAERAAKQPVTEAAGVKGLSDGGLAKRGAANRGGRGGPGMGRGAAAVTKPPAPAPPAPVRGGKVARPPARTPAGRGRPAAAAQPDKPPINDTKPQLPANNTKQDSCPNIGETAEEPAVSDSVSVSGPVNRRSHVSRLGLARALSRSAHTQDQAQQLFQEVISMAPGVHDAYTELVQLLEPTEPQAAVEVYCRFPLKPADQQSFCDAFITGEIVRMLMAQEQYDHPQLGPNLVAYGKVMGLGCIEKYIDILDGKFLYKLLKSVYAMIHDRPEEDEELQDFFKFKCWI